MGVVIARIYRLSSKVVASPVMVMCFESFVGPQHGEEVIKLEQQILVTETGNELVTRYQSR